VFGFTLKRGEVLAADEAELAAAVETQLITAAAKAWAGKWTQKNDE
jgi:hypothetical protein